MNYLKLFLLVALLHGFVTATFAQHKRYSIKNGIALRGGLTHFDILTDNFETKSNSGFIGGMSSVVDLPQKWYNVSYNISLSENSVSVSARPETSSLIEFVDYKLLTAQISFLGHLKIIGNNLTLDLGPMLQYNGELELKDSSKSEYLVTGLNNVSVSDISDVTKFNVNGAIGLTAGIGKFALRGQYIYGFTNFLGRLSPGLNEDGGGEKFKGHLSMFTITALFIL